MTRENIKQYLLQIKQKDGEEVLSNRWQPDILVEIIDKIYDEHEVQLKALYFQITELKMMEEDAQQYALRCSKELKAKDEEIERLKDSVQQWHKRSIKDNT